MSSTGPIMRACPSSSIAQPHDHGESEHHSKPVARRRRFHRAAFDPLVEVRHARLYEMLCQAFGIVDRVETGVTVDNHTAEATASRTAVDVLRLVNAGEVGHGIEIGMAALSRARHLGASYARDQAPTSPHPGLSHNTRPGRTPLTWLRGWNKCNQFVGDALTEAGFRMPTYRMRDGSQHYMNAEALPDQARYFARVTSAAEIAVGDVIVHDYPGRGANTAHTEVVTGRDAARGIVLTAGAHHDGAYERDWSSLLDDASYNAQQARWEKPDGSCVYVLRARRKGL
jgi:hypothetical protein